MAYSCLTILFDCYVKHVWDVCVCLFIQFCLFIYLFIFYFINRYWGCAFFDEKMINSCY